MQTSKEVILLYNIQPDERLHMFLNLLDRLSLSYRILSTEDAEQTLGFLLDKNGFAHIDTASSVSAPQGEMMIFSNLSDLHLDTLLKTLRTSGIPPVALKAVVTETNINWPLKKLYANLLMEHLQMRRLQQKGPGQA